MRAGDTIDMTPAVCAAIDDALRRLRGRNLVSGSEVVDLLLDLRLCAEVGTLAEECLATVPG